MRLLVAAVAMAALGNVQTRRRADRHRAVLSADPMGTRCMFSTMGECEAAKGRPPRPSSA